MQPEPAHFRLGYRETINFYAQALTTADDQGGEAVNNVRRELGQTDLFFLLVFILKRTDLLHPWLFARCRDVQREPDNHLDLWAREHYKMQRLDEPTPTPDGWKAHGDLVVGDRLFAPDGSTTKVIALSPIYTDGECYEIEFDDGETIECGADHLWQVERRTRKRVAGTFKIDGIGKRKYRERVILQTREIFAHNHRQDSRLAVSVNSALIMPECFLPIHPYVLGAWLGDGTSANGDITCGDDELFSFCAKFGYELGHNKAPNRNAATRRIIGLQKELKGLSLIRNKHIPIKYLRASIEQRLMLLRGLMDTDGHCSTRGTATFVNTNERLADGVYELAASLGLKPIRYVYKNDHGDVWHISFQSYSDPCPFLLKRKVCRCKGGARKNARRMIVGCRRIESVPMRCIQVDRSDGMYLTGKAMIPTHNSTIITFGLTIFDIIKDPEITIGIFSHTKPVAKKFLSQIKTEFESNADLPALWPDIFHQNPKAEAQKWSEDTGIIVKRDGNPKEATIEAHGLVDGQPTGRHFKLRVYDDVVTMESVSTPEQIAKTTHAWQMSDNLGCVGGRERYIGTPYHLFDTYRVMQDSKVVTIRKFPATVDGKEYGKPVLMPEETLLKKRRTQGPYVFAAQMLIDPVADKAMGFRREWLVLEDVDYQAAMRSLFRFIIVDPAGSKQRKNNDYTTMFVMGYGEDEKYRVLDMRRDRLNLTGRTDLLMALHRHWKPSVVGYEEYGIQADIEHIKYVQKQDLYEFDITPVGGAMSKDQRIRRLVPLFENGFKDEKDGGDGLPKSRIILPTTCYVHDYQDQSRDLVKDFIEQEYTAFPVLSHDDMLDALARTVDLMEMGLIEKPKVVVPTARRLHNLGKTGNSSSMGNDSWLTA